MLRHVVLCQQQRTDLLGLVRASPERREDAVGPVVGGDVEPAEHLRRRDRLGVHPHLLVPHALRQRTMESEASRSQVDRVIEARWAARTCQMHCGLTG